jgi:hypothetical protein
LEEALLWKSSSSRPLHCLRRSRKVRVLGI